MLQMPPSKSYLQSLSGPQQQLTEASRILHSIIWIPRLFNSKWYNLWMKDALTKMSQNQSPVAEALLQDLSESVTTLSFSTKILMDFMNNLIEKYANCDEKDQPTVMEMLTLEAVVLKTLHHMENFMSGPDAEVRIESGSSRRGSQDRDEMTANMQNVRKAANHLLPLTIKTVCLFYRFIRCNVVKLSESDQDSSEIHSSLDPEASHLLIQIASGKCGKISSFALSASNHLPKPLKSALDKWNRIQVDTTCFKNDLSSSETLIQGTESYHLQSILLHPVVDDQRGVDVSLSLKHVTNSLIKFAEELFMQSFPATSGSNHLQSILFEDFSSVVIPLHLDSTLESFSGYGCQAVETIWGTKESEDFLSAAYYQGLDSAYRLITDFQSGVDERILLEALKFIEALMSTSPGQRALEKYFCDSDETPGSHEKDLVSLFMSAANMSLSTTYSARVLKVFVKLLEQTDKNPDTISLVRLCTSLTKLTKYSADNNRILVTWLTKIFIHQR